MLNKLLFFLIISTTNLRAIENTNAQPDVSEANLAALGLVVPPAVDELFPRNSMPRIIRQTANWEPGVNYLDEHSEANFYVIKIHNLWAPSQELSDQELSDQEPSDQEPSDEWRYEMHRLVGRNYIMVTVHNGIAVRIEPYK